MLPAPVVPHLDETSKLMNHIYPGGVPGVAEGTMVEYVNPATRNHGGLLSFEFTGNVLESTGRLILSDLIILFLQLTLFSLIVMPHYKNQEATSDDPAGQRLGVGSESDESSSSQDPLLEEDTPLTPRDQMIEDRISGRSVAGEIAIWPAVTNVIRHRNVNRYQGEEGETPLQEVPQNFGVFRDLEGGQNPNAGEGGEGRASWLSGMRSWARSVEPTQQGGQRLGTQPNEQ